ncbi:MAG: glycosyltransferase family 4 protein [Chloroflexi bacterium]|nr:glycosyltransferase family 4 protein [Chloroflexota bacterium]
MNLAFVVPGFAAAEKDWCIPAHTEIVRALAAEHDVHVFTLRYPHRADTYRIGNATVHSFGGADVRGIATAQLWQRVAREIAREHARNAFDVIHAIFGGEAGCLAVLSGKFLRAPSVVWLVNGELVGLREIGYGAALNAPLRWMNEIVLRYADSILCGCEAMVASAEARVDETRRARVELLPLGVDTTRFNPSPPAPLRKGNGASQFVNVGSLLPVKDQATLLRAFALVRREMPDAHLTIAGTGPLENALRALAADLQIDSCVTFAGNVPYEKLPALCRSADVFVQASRHEGQGMALLEAAACGCAVCGTKVGALRDLARRDAAIAAAVGDTAALADAMQYAFAERARLSAQSQQITDREYNLKHIAKRLVALYAHLI